MKTEPTKPIATSADGAGMEQASTTGQPAPDADAKDVSAEATDTEDEAAQLGDFA